MDSTKPSTYDLKKIPLNSDLIAEFESVGFKHNKVTGNWQLSRSFGSEEDIKYGDTQGYYLEINFKKKTLSYSGFSYGGMAGFQFNLFEPMEEKYDEETRLSLLVDLKHITMNDLIVLKDFDKSEHIKS